MNLCQYWPHLLSDVDGNQRREGHTFLVVISEIHVCSFELYDILTLKNTLANSVLCQ